MSSSELAYEIVKYMKGIIPGLDENMIQNGVTSILSEYRVTRNILSSNHSMDLLQKIEMYISAKKLEGLSPVTLTEYSTKLNNFSKYINKKVECINTNDIRLYLGTFHEINLASSIDTKLSVLKSFFTWLYEEEIISKDPTKKIRPLKKRSRMRESLTVEELELVREACSSTRERALLEFLYSTGCRLDEVYKLNKADIDWNNMSVNVIGKGDKQRKVYISPKTKIHMNKYFLSRKDTSDVLFCTERKPYRRLGHRTIQEIIQTIGERANIGRRVHPHLLRHTLATFMVNNGCDISTIQKILGHTSPSTTQVYAKLSDEVVKNEYMKHLII